MSRTSVRAVLAVLGVLAVLAAAPLQAKPSRVAAKGTATFFGASAFLADLWERAARLLGRSVPVEKEGVTIDPEGATAPTPPPYEGTSIDPDGRT